MKKYHKYVFDSDNRKFIGDFEGMYSNEEKEGFDSWYQSDQNHITKRIAFTLLADVNFSRVIDIGCGTGSFTHRLKRFNTRVVGVDISASAIEKAKKNYPEVIWHTGSIVEIPELIISLKWPSVDLIVVMEVLSYIENWQTILKQISENSCYIFLSLYIPKDPIGFVKNRTELHMQLIKLFEPIQQLSVFEDDDETILWLGKSRNYFSFQNNENV